MTKKARGGKKTPQVIEKKLKVVKIVKLPGIEFKTVMNIFRKIDNMITHHRTVICKNSKF